MIKETNKFIFSPLSKGFSKSKGRPLLSDYFSCRNISIRSKLTILTLTIIALMTVGASIVAIQVIRLELIDSLAKRGASIGLSASIPAGFSILNEDRLALDNLAAKIEASEEDILYFAILDNNRNTLAHNNLSETRSLFEAAKSDPLKKGPDFTMHMVNRNGLSCYEFQTPILFTGKHVGSIIVGIDAATLLTAEESARQRIFLIALAVLAFGFSCTFLLSKSITRPIERLSSGVSQITSGDYHVAIKVTSKDELGELTSSFNEMSGVIMSQKDSLENYASNLEDSCLSTIRILAVALDARDTYTLGHSARVANLSVLIGQRLGLPREELKDLETSCFLHDIGKIHVPDMIINKPGRLTQEEYQLIKKHPEQGAEILHLAESLHKYIPTVLHHHESYNGEGYPAGLKGKEIPTHAQIVTIADSYDAMTSSRSYREGCSRKEATETIRKFRGIQFNPDLADIFLIALNEYEDDHALFSLGGIHEKHDFLHLSNSSVSDNVYRLRDFAPPQGQGVPKTAKLSSC